MLTMNRVIPIGLIALTLTVFACGKAAETDTAEANMAADSVAPASNAMAQTPDSARYHGIDVSHHQGDVDWATVKAAGITFVYAKATEGNDYLDPKFVANWEALKEAGIVRGAYHFFHPNDDPATQAEFFISTVKLEPGDLPPVLDIEVADGVTAEGIDKDIQVWLEKVSEAYGVQPIIYSDLNFIQANLQTGFGTYPLWLADYTEAMPPAPEEWEAWTFWQQTDDEIIEGIPGTVDRSIHHGTVAHWEALLVPPVE